MMIRLMGLFLILSCLWGCNTPPKPFEYESDRELKPGKGLFSGEDGVFTIYTKDQEPVTEISEKQE